MLLSQAHLRTALSPLPQVKQSTTTCSRGPQLKQSATLYYSLMYSHLTYALLAWRRLGVLTGENANYSQIITKRSPLLIYDYFALLKAFNTCTLHFHQYFKDKLSSRQPSHMHNTRHRTNSNFNTQLFNIQKLKKIYLYHLIPICIQPTKFA